MTSRPPIVQLIHASDAPQHTGELKSILQRMKSENRILDFSALDVSSNPESITFKTEDHQGIIVLLTNEIESVRTEIENLLRNVTQEKQNIKLIEIIVDNLPYHNSFISFPQDLMPIRSRVDMNLVWNGIEQDLHAMFPIAKEPEIEVTPATDNRLKKYLKLAGLTLATLALCNILVFVISPRINDNPYITLNIFVIFLPLIVLSINRKSLEPENSVSETRKQTNGIDWKQLIIRTLVAFIVLLGSFYIWAIALIRAGIDMRNSAAPAILAAATTLLFLFYRRKSEGTKFSVQSDGPSSQIKSFLRFVGVLLFFVLLSSIFWIIVFEALEIHYGGSHVALLTIVTTILLLLVRQIRKRAKPSP